MRDLTVTLVQTELSWHQPEVNRQHFAGLINQLEQPADLIILPEMFTTGFTMDATNQAEPVNQKTLHWLQQQAKHANATIITSVATNTGDYCVNRLYCVHSDGEYQHYDKRHLFAMANEHQYYQPGQQRLVTLVNGWRICPMICYDLRFPVWNRNQLNENKQADYDLLLFVANWPAKRRQHWRKLLQARAIENQSYCIGVNRIGSDDNGLSYAGDSLIADPQGEVISDAEAADMTITSTLSAEYLQQTRQQLPFLTDADQFEITCE